MKAIVITPVKDSPETVRKTISAVSEAHGDFDYYIYNDFSNIETKDFLENNQSRFRYTLINLEEYTNTPSPNYNLVLKMGQKIAIERQVHLILIESDVIIRSNTITDLISIAENVTRPGLIGLATVDHHGRFNFPYSYLKENEEFITETSKSLSFCCTLLSLPFINEYSFDNLPSQKDWYDIFISRQSRRSGFKNYLIKKDAVLHIPHSSRPWKQLKYTHPFRYYLHKILHKRDRI
jgi:hypothetical protein